MKVRIIERLIKRFGSVRLVISFFLVALAVSCKGQKRTALQAEQQSETTLELIVSDHYGGGEITETVVIRDGKTLTLFFSKINLARKPGFPIPHIDFTKELIVVVCGGKRKDGATPELKVKEVTDSRMILTVIQTTTSTTSAVGAITTPFSLYKLPLTEKHLVFEK